MTYKNKDRSMMTHVLSSMALRNKNNSQQSKPTATISFRVILLNKVRKEIISIKQKNKRYDDILLSDYNQIHISFMNYYYDELLSRSSYCYYAYNIIVVI